MSVKFAGREFEAKTRSKFCSEATNAERNPLALEATERILNNGIQIDDVFGNLGP